MKATRITIALLLLLQFGTTQAQSGFIDSHLHYLPGDARIVHDRATIVQQMQQAGFSQLFVSVSTPDAVAAWQRVNELDVRVLVSFPCKEGKYPRGNPCFTESQGWPPLDWLRQQIENDAVHGLGELLFAYDGIAPDDPRMMPYYQLAVENQIPITVHAGHGPPPRARMPGCCPDFDENMGNPAKLKPVLARYPELRVLLLHGGEIQFRQQAIGLMLEYPQVYAELSIVNSRMPLSVYQQAIDDFRQAGLLNRIVFGTDNVDPGSIIQRMEQTNLTKTEVSRILTDNPKAFWQADKE